jgi:formylmethanofuran--tetrahydromethanopterin N-formyltransferase
LAAAENTLTQVATIPWVVVKCAASGSKVGAKNYSDMVATTNDVYCPTLAAKSGSRLENNVRCVYEIIVSGPRESDVRRGMKVGIEAATGSRGVLAIHTANYGGKLGSGKIPLHSLFRSDA